MSSFCELYLVSGCQSAEITDFTYIACVSQQTFYSALLTRANLNVTVFVLLYLDIEEEFVYNFKHMKHICVLRDAYKPAVTII